MAMLALGIAFGTPAPEGQETTAGSRRRIQAPLPPIQPGVYSRSMERSGELTINYAIAVPPTYSTSTRVPLVLALHYGGGPGSGRGVLVSLVHPALTELGAIIVAPDSINGAWDTPQNDRAVNELLDAILSSYNVDPTRVVVTGYSMGGRGTWSWAARYPTRFSAAIPVAGFPASTAAAWQVPVFAVHSRGDEVVPIGATEQRIAELRKLGKNAQLVVLSGITHYETARHADGLRRAVPWLKDLWK
jgi:predicted peptidase